MTRKHAEPQVEIAQHKIVQIPSHFIDLAVINKLSGTEWALWMYLCRVCPFGDLTKGGEKVFKSLPSPAQLAILLGRSEKQISRAAKTIEELGLYSFKIESWRGYNETAVAAKAVLERLEQKRKDGTQTKMSSSGQKSPKTDKNVQPKTKKSDTGQKSLGESSEPSPEAGLTNPHTIQTSSEVDKTTTDAESVAAISFDCEENDKMAEPGNLSNNSTPVSGELSVKPQDPVVPASSYDSNQEMHVSCLDVELSSGEKSSARAATHFAPKHTTLISEFSDWLTQKGRGDCVKDLAGLRSVIQGADEAVLTDAIAHVKEKIDGLKNFGGYFRRALENKWQPQQAIAPVVSTVRPTGLQPLDKSGFLGLDNSSIEARLPRPTGYCDAFQKSVFELGNALKQRGLLMPEYWMGDVWGMRGQLSPIAKYYESRNLDFSPIQPHLASEYVILESDKLPVICFLDAQTGNYELVVISGRW